ncbi:beta strand repeat-containing protein [Flaviaesturariibacter aridisoli]|uniref:beta strand repeat-containing protein n=1 Tax=Flaviaesturariibacter aridisoli TaxID=2545761 RepID=UPI001404D8CC|nr:hypothetical protein [Flaviaesturariibacter aridisoli]
MNRPGISWAFLLFLILSPAARLLAQTGTANGTYDFSALGAAESGGPGLKTQQDKFLVSTIFAQFNSRMYANNATAGASQSVVLKANNSVIKTFTLKDMSFQNAGATNYSLSVFTITMKDFGGNTIATHSLASNASLNTSTTGAVNMSSFPFSVAWPVSGYNNVNSVEITFQYFQTNVRPNNMDWVNWTLANLSNTTPSGVSVGSISGSPFCAGATVSVPYTATGINAGNTYTAQLSDASGSFASPTSIGTAAGNASSGTISAVIPTGTTSGTGYRIRIVANDPSVTSSDNGSNLTINPKPSAAITAFTNISCFGGNNGSLTVTASGGTAGYTYSWSPSGGTGSTASNLSAGSYTVTVSDTKGCQATASQTLTQPASALSASAAVTNVSCFGGSNASIDITVTGGTSPYTYNWGSGVTSEDRSGLVAGTYGVTVTDNKGCSFTLFPINVTQPSAAVSGSTVVTNVACFGGNTGAINLTPTGGNGGYTFLWNNGATTEDRTFLTAGTYSVTITDSKGCTGAVNNITVSQPTSGVSGTTVVTNVACFGGNTGAINLTPTGGTAGYTFMWNGGATTEDRTGLTAGNYSVTITDANGCQGTVGTITVSQPTAPVSGTTVVTNIACFGGNTGAINLTPTGGTPGYTYLWNNGSTTTEDRTGLTAGTYSVTITDNNGCTGTVSNISVSQPAAPVSGVSVVTNVACFGGNTGAINLTPIGGTGPYTFLWNSGATTEDRTSLTAGSYSVTITDNNGCTGTVSNIAVSQPTAPVSGTTVVTNVACFGGNTGAINLTPAGGTGPYTFLWNNGATTEDRTGLSTGNYSVTITDNNGCQSTVSNISVGQPSDPLSASTVVTNIACFGGNTGAINLTPSGGTSPYTFLWNNGTTTTEDRTGLSAGTYSVTITDNNGCQATINNISVSQPAAALSGSTVVTNNACFGGSTGAINLTPAGGTSPYTFLWNNGSTSEDRNGLAAGTYSVTIADANGCQATISNISVGQPSAAVSGSTILTNPTCNGAIDGTIDLTPAGGVPGYTYNWSDGPTTQDRTGLGAGTYSVTITDANSCQATISNITLTDPALPTVNAVASQVVCADQTTSAITFGGTAASYTWANNNNSIGLPASGSGDIGSFSATNGGSTAIVATITVTPMNGACSGAATSFTITVNPAPSATIAYTATPYFTGSGTAAVTQSGTTGGTYSSTTGIALDPATGTIDLAASTPGTYTVTYTVAAAGGCDLYTTTTTVNLVNPFSATIVYNGSPYCDATGIASVTRTGTTGGTYSASPAGLSINATTGDINLAASAPGTYTVRYGTTPTDFTTTQVAIRPSVFVNAQPNPVVCNGSTVGPILFTGAPGLTFSWTAGNPNTGIPASGTGNIAAFTATNNGNTATQSYVYVEANGGTGCSPHNMIFRITVNPTPVIGAVADQTLCAGTPTNAVNFTSTVAGTTISWTNSNSSIGLQASGTGNIPSFNATNNTGVLQTATISTSAIADGCSSSPTSFTIAVSPSAGSISYPQSTYCQYAWAYVRRTGSTGGSYSASPAGLALNSSDGSINLGASTPGTYTVTYTVGASGGCSGTASTTLTINPQSFVDNLPNQLYCNGVATAPIAFTGNATSYTWTNNNTSIGLAASGSGTALPSFTTVNAGPGVQYANVRVTPQGNGSSNCPGRGFTFRIAVNYCGPIAQSGGTGGNDGTLRTALSQDFEVGPNPARSNVVLRYSGAEQGPFTVQLLSQYGQPIGRVFSFTGTTYTLDLSDVTPGAYSLQVTHVKSGVVFNKQVIKL